MSFSLDQEVTCAACGEPFAAALWSSINVREHPALQEEILAGQLNVVDCPRCGRIVYAERFVLYHDPDAELMAFVYPKDYEADADKWRGKTAEDFAVAQASMQEKERLPYRPLTLFGLDALVALIQEEQEKVDQGDILEALAPSLPLEFRRLRRSLARAHGLPAALPLSKDREKNADDRLREGLKVLLEANDRLKVYADLLERLTRGDLELSFLEKGAGR